MNRYNWYYRQKVGEAEMDGLQANIEQAIANVVMDLFAVGWVTGANLQPGTGMSVKVTPGRGYDEQGQRIFIPSTQTIDMTPYRPTTSGREAWVLVAGRFKRVLSDPRTDGNGQTVYFKEDESFEIVCRKGTEAATGSATKPAKQAGDVIIGYVRVYYGQTSIAAGDISTAERQQMAAHPAAEISVADAGGKLAATNVEDALQELAGDIDAHASRTDNPHQTTAAQVGALVSVDGVSNPGGNVDLVAGGAITVSPDNSGKKITISETHSSRTDNPHSVTAEQVGAVRNAGGVPKLQAGTEASRPAAGEAGRLYISTDTQRIWRDTGTAWQLVGVVQWSDVAGKPTTFPPSAHKSTHASGGSDPLTPADIGAVSKAGDTMTGGLALPSLILTGDGPGKVNLAAADIDVNGGTDGVAWIRHMGTGATRALRLVDGYQANTEWAEFDYAAKAIRVNGNVVWHAGNDGSGSGLDADTLDGAHAGTGANNILQLDASGLVPLANIPNTLTGKTADLLDGYHANTGTAASTIPVRDASGKLPGSITGDADTVDGAHAGTGANNVLKLDANALVPLANVPSLIRYVTVARTTGWSVTATGAWEDILTLAVTVGSDEGLALVYGIVPRLTNTAPSNTIVRCRIYDTNSGATLAEATQHIHSAGGSQDWTHFAVMAPWVPASGSQTLRLQINSSGTGIQAAADGAGRYAHLWVLLLKRVQTS